MSEIHFKKYHGLGNDYLVIDPNISPTDLTEETIRILCDRHFGIGADGILYGPITNTVDRFEVRIFNPDGSEAEKSGNGLRIFARYLHELHYVQTTSFDIHTPGGVVTAHLQDDIGNVIKIDMGKVTFRSTEIPVAGGDRQVVNEAIDINSGLYKVTCLSIGNPHCVIPMSEVSEAKAKTLGPLVEHHALFPNRINMQIVKVVDRQALDIRIWERGAGYTLASGSSACAAAAASHKLGLVDSPINVSMPGGSLRVDIDDVGLVCLTGPVEKVFEGYLTSPFPLSY